MATTGATRTLAHCRDGLESEALRSAAVCVGLGSETYSIAENPLSGFALLALVEGRVAIDLGRGYVRAAAQDGGHDLPYLGPPGTGATLDKKAITFH